MKTAMAELSKSHRGDESDTIKLSELLYGRHFKGTSYNCFSLAICFENTVVISSGILLNSLCILQ